MGYDYITYWKDRDWYELDDWGFKELLKPHLKKGSVLDIGCGAGRFADLFQDYHGFDINDRDIQMAQRLYPNKSFEVADLVTWDTNKRYDLVFGFTILEHIPHDLIEEVAKKIKRWGKNIILVEPVGFTQEVAHCTPHDYKKLFNGTITQLNGLYHLIKAKGEK